MMKQWGLVLLALGVGLLAACGGPGSRSICGAQVCVTDTRLVRVGQGTIALILRVTEPDGSFDPEAPPRFTDGLHVTLVAEESSRRILDRDFSAADISCLAGTNVPGAEGSLVAACLLTIDESELAAPPEANGAVTLTLYSETFPTALMEVRFP